MVGALVLTAFFLGFVGFALYCDNLHVEKSTTDLAYLALQLFVLESGDVPGPGLPWQLEVARWLAPATTVAALAAALAMVFRGELEEMRLRRRRRRICALFFAPRSTLANAVSSSRCWIRKRSASLTC